MDTTVETASVMVSSRAGSRSYSERCKITQQGQNIFHQFVLI